MSNFNFWYKSTIKAENLAQALKKNEKAQPKFHSVDVEEEKHDQLPDCIGFNYEVYEED